MKKICLLLLLICHITWGQNKTFKGIIKDSETLQPIHFVNIYTENELNTNLTGSISNENGEFLISTSSSKIVFSHINYETLSIEFDGNFKEIVLKPKNYISDEIIISKEDPRDYLKKVIVISKSKIDKNVLLKSYCREIVKVNKEYTKFSDALLDYYVKKGNGKSNLILGQHRALKSEKINDEDNSNIDNINSAFNVQDYVKNAYNFDIIENLLKDSNYEFEIKLKKEADGEEFEYVRVIPNEESDEMLNTGFIIIDSKTKCILEYKLYTSEKHLKNAKLNNLIIAKLRLNKSFASTKFRIINDQYILVYNNFQADVHLKMGKLIDDDFDFKYDLFVYEFKNNVEIPNKGYNKKTLYEAGNDFSEKFWTKLNVFPLSENDEKFINSIQQK